MNCTGVIDENCSNLIFKKNGIIFLSGIEDSSHPGNYFKSLKAFVSMAVKQAAGGVPSGNHGLFHRYVGCGVSNSGLPN